MGKTFSCQPALAALVVLMISHPAKADIVYPFVQMTCDPVSRSVSLKSFYDENESGKERTASPGRDIYPAYHVDGSIEDTKGSCDFGIGQTISLITHQGPLPKNDGVNLFINGQKLERGFTLNDEWTMNIHQEAPNRYSVKFCPTLVSSLSTISAKDFEEVQASGVRKCDLLEVNKKGFIVKAETVDPGPTQ
jgi:hypothetical protein